MNNPIKLKNIGPIESVTIPIPAEGGVVVLRGRNGAGKSTALDAIQSAITGRGKPPLRDKAAKGEVCAGGVSLTVQKSIRRSGQLEVTSLDSRLSVADLVDPGIVDPLRADASRIKALVNLSRTEIHPDDLHGFPDNLLDGLNLSDPVGAMAELKKRLDIGAREYEKLAKESGDKAAALLESIDDEALLAQAVDESLLQATLINAQRDLDRLNDQAQYAQSTQDRATESREKLSTLPLVDVAALEKQHSDAIDTVEARKAAAQKLKEQYNAAVEAYRAEHAELGMLLVKLDSAKQSAALRQQLEMQIADAAVEAPPPETIEAAQQRLKRAYQAMEEASVAKHHRQAHAKAVDLAEESQRLDEESKLLRQKSRYTEEVLSEIIADLGCPLRCIDGRLVANTDRGPTFYSDLSEGERWKMALDIAVAALGDRGLLVVPQSAWEGLDPTNRAMIAGCAKAAGVVVITAECDQGDLVAVAHEQEEIAA